MYKNAAELAEVLEAADARVAAAVAQANIDYRTNKDTRSRAAYIGYKLAGYVAAVVVKHGDKARSFEASRDGGPCNHFYPPTKIIRVEPESTDEFILMLFPRWYADKLRDELKINLLGVTPDLTTSREWSDDQLAAWKSLERTASRINTRTRNACRQRFSGKRSDYA